MLKHLWWSRKQKKQSTDQIVEPHLLHFSRVNQPKCCKPNNADGFTF